MEGFFSYIKRKNEIDPSIPFHSYDLFEHPTTKRTLAQSKHLLLTIADFISMIPIQINIIQINKEMFRKALGVVSDEDFKFSRERNEMKEFPYRIMSTKLFSWFARYLQNSDSIGQIVVDSRKGGDTQLIKSLDMCKSVGGPINIDESKLIKERCSAICFAEKTFLSGGLEITDLISYVSFFHIRRLMSSMKECGLPKVWLQIKKQLKDGVANELRPSEVKRFFKINRNEVYKALNNKK